jgi:DNA-binding NarL/FixJ family response regulator
MGIMSGKPKLRLLLAIHTRELKTAFFVALDSQPLWELVATAANAAELLTYSHALHPDAIVLEWELPGRPMAEVLPALAQTSPCTEISVICRPSSWQQVRDLAPTARLYEDPEELIASLEALQPASQCAGHSNGH